jgi:transposase
MIGLGKAALKIFVALEPRDMRKSFNGLPDAAVRHLNDGKLGTDILFVFINNRKDRIKLLYFDGTGLWVAAKRLDAGRFSWPKPSEGGQKKIRLRPEVLQLILDGVDLRGATLKPSYEGPQT